jgi:hypothetical protein
VPSPRRVRLTERDRELLAFVAEHRLVLAEHVGALLGVSAATAYGRLRALSGAGLLTSKAIFHGRPGHYQITRQGLAAIDSSLPPPKLDVRGYDHDVGLAWLWLAAKGGAFGELRDIVSERQMRSSDGRPDRHGERFGVRLGGVGAGGRERLHYPDLVLDTASGHRVAVELELTGKGRTRRETILAGYGSDHRIDAVLYLVEDAALARSIRSSAARLGISSLIHVQRFARGASMRDGAAGRAPERAPVRTAVAETGR